MHSVSDVRATFAHHNLPLSVVTRTKVSTSLLPTPYARALHVLAAWGIFEGLNVGPFSPAQAEFLRHHRTNVFRDAQ